MPAISHAAGALPPTTAIDVKACGVNSPVAIAQPGGTAIVTIGADAAARVMCPNLYKGEPRLPARGSRRVLIMDARLEPLPHFFVTSHGDYRNDLAETATIRLKLLNITSAPILLTGAAADFSHASRVRSSAGGRGETTLAPSHGSSALILLQPGESRELSLDRGVRLAGIAKVLPGYPWMSTASIWVDEKSQTREDVPRLMDHRMLPEFNRLLLQLYGRDTRIGVTIFEGDYVPVARAEIPIADGVDFFYRANNGGPTNPETPVRFDHSAFLAQAMLDFRRNGAGRGKPPVVPEPVENGE